jgi:hypothetical protein
MDPVAAYIACFLASRLGVAEECGVPPWRELRQQGYRAAVFCAVVKEASAEDAAQLCLRGRACERVAVHRNGRIMFLCTGEPPVS